MTEYRAHEESVRYTRLLNRVTNSTQLEKFIKAIDKTESQLQDELDNFIESRTHVQEERRLELSRTELSTTLSSSSSLVELLSNAGSLASKITARVRLLDAERSRVRETATYVGDVKELKALILTANSALEVHDWAQASRAIEKIRSLPIEGEFINNVVPSTDVPESPKLTLEKWIEELTKIFTTEFQKAAESKDVEKLTSFFSFFPMIGKNHIGLDNYSKFICNIIANQSRLIITNQSQQDKYGFYPAALMRLLEIISSMLNQHSTIIAKYYGISNMTGIIERVEREADSQAGLISDTFYDNRQISRLIDEIQAYKFPILTNYSTMTSNSSRGGTPPPRSSFDGTPRTSEDNLSVVHIGDVTTEFSAFLKYWSLYCRFVAVKWNEYQGLKQDELKLPKPILESKFGKKIQTKLLPSFEVLLTFYIRRSLEQALQIEEFPDLNPLLTSSKIIAPENPPISSTIEDLILVLSTSLKQAIETGQPLTVKNLVTNIKKILDNDYYLTIYKRLREFQPRSGTIFTPTQNNITSTTSHYNQQQHQQQQQKTNTMGSIFSRGATALNHIASGDETRLHTFVVLLNTVNVGANYFEKIINQNLALLNNNYPFGTDSEKLKNIIQGLLDGFTKRSNDILNEFIEILFNQVFKNKLKILLTDCFKDADYLISNYNEESETSVVHKFINQWNSLIAPYYKTLDPLIFDKFMFTVVTTLSNLLERKIWSLDNNITELGSIKLERDFSGIIGEITRSRYNLRDKFLRVTQVIMILGFDDEDDEIDMNWVLTPSERQRARNLRVDKK
ncbi:Conserved oligomeric Golgi complex subunit [Wickerhamomyces ciferrii]|uniref:Conserved oligomeric Golgi complex subunit 4 n=1 Tax=Wickerhamomyces ciferrii (strain ATCC 14091 / BCRC 22168 / CBS 111 / JCM 3599 / NBRC 0793 / NRRL Y-1031 F-60-10) TaxID=1206466 RepID=K0KE72_WICCF|nr:Conserved oligomeric Golgi complex subunit [Wickerhamomyces ciferrii]CCH40542.1 Conserved oligomeric Golgi complex subunit [Wickerhamomyces ciferrii]